MQRSASAVKTEKFTQQQEGGPRSWVLDHVAEIVYLVSQIQLTQQVREALEELEAGKKDALKVSAPQGAPICG